MPSRKLVKHGKSTFMVSLPKPWVDEHNLKKGDSIVYEENSDSVSFFSGKRNPTEKSIEVDFTGLDKSFIMFHLRGLYRQGYQEIKVTFQDPVVVHHRTGEKERVTSIISEEANRLVGIEISDQSTTSVMLNQLAEPSVEELKSSFKRAFFLLTGAYEGILTSTEEEDLDALEEVRLQHNTITMLVSYCVRLLTTVYKGNNQAYLMRLIMDVDVKAEILEGFSKMVRRDEVKFSKEALDILEIFKESHDIERALIFSWDNKKANEFDRKREEVKERISSHEIEEEKKYLYHLLPLLELYREMLVTRLSMPPGELFR